MMSSSNHSTSDLEDAFSSMNILNYTSVSSDYFPASSGSISFNSPENSNIIPSVISPLYNNTYLKNVQAFYAKELHISSPDPITPLAILTPSLILLPSLLIPPKRMSTSEAPTLTHATIEELVAHSIVVILKAQAAMMASTNNPNSEPRKTSVERNCAYEKFTSYQLSYFNVMSSASSAVTYTSVYTDSEPGRVFWGADEEISDGGSPRVIVYGYDGLPMQLVAPPSPNYVPRPKHPSSPNYVSGPKHPPPPVYLPYVPESEYPVYLAPSDDEAPTEDQPLPDDASPIALSPGYDGDDEPSDDDDDDDDTDDEEEEEPSEDEDDDEEEEEHLAPTDSSIVPVANPFPSVRDTEAFETDESAPTPRSPPIRVPFAQTHLRRARKTVRLEPPMSASMEARIAEYAAAPTPPLPVASPPLPLPSPLTTSPTDAGGIHLSYERPLDSDESYSCITTLITSIYFPQD
ncbi:hypothetical protein Tco_0006095 [Tanacetum coccineum]